MRRTLVAGAAVLTALLIPGPAGGTAERGYENEYAGSVKNAGKNYFGFDVEGKQVTNISFYFNFDGPCNGDLLTHRYTDELQIKHKEFKGTITAVVGDHEHKLRLRGKLKPHNKAKGKLNATAEKAGEGTCQGPKGKWKAKEPPSR